MDLTSEGPHLPVSGGAVRPPSKDLASAGVSFEDTGGSALSMELLLTLQRIEEKQEAELELLRACMVGIEEMNPHNSFRMHHKKKRASSQSADLESRASSRGPSDSEHVLPSRLSAKLSAIGEVVPPRPPGTQRRMQAVANSIVVSRSPGVSSVDNLHASLSLARIMRPSVRKGLWRFLEDRSSSWAAALYSQFVSLLVFVGVFNFWMEEFLNIEMRFELALGMQAFFASEMILRFLVCPNRHTFALNFYNWLDLITTILIAPIVTAEMFRTDSLWASETVLVFCPVLMLLKLLRRFRTFHLLVNACRDAAEALPVLLYTLFVICLLFSALIYSVEPRDNVPTLPHAMWLIIVTVSTVGYGDISPVTVPGYVVMSVLIIIAGLYTSIPIGLVGTAFGSVWEDRERIMLLQHIKDYITWAGFSIEDVQKMFEALDDNGDCQLSFDEFKQILPLLEVDLPEHMSRRIFQSFDNDDQGTIDFQEFMRGVFPMHRFFLVHHTRSSAKGSMSFGSQVPHGPGDVTPPTEKSEVS